jgi:hypothetical protein
MEIGGEDVVGAEQSLHAHRGGDVRRRDQPAQVGDRQDEHAEHPVGAVDEGQPLLLLERHRRDPVLPQCGRR